MSHVYLQDTKYSNAWPGMGVMSTEADQLNCVRDTRDEAGFLLSHFRIVHWVSANSNESLQWSVWTIMSANRVHIIKVCSCQFEINCSCVPQPEFLP